MMAERDGFEQQWKAKISEDLTLRSAQPQRCQRKPAQGDASARAR